MDNLTKKQRSLCMSHIKSKDTAVELRFRKYIWGKGMRGYRVKNEIAGKPDLYLPKARIAVFVDGCFWHKCPKCFIRPKSKNKYWDSKIKNNIKRDKKINSSLKKQGVLVVRFWEHEIKEDIYKCYLKLRKIYEKKV